MNRRTMVRQQKGTTMKTLITALTLAALIAATQSPASGRVKLSRRLTSSMRLPLLGQALPITASGHAATPPSSVMNSRLFTRSPRRRATAASVGFPRRMPCGGEIDDQLEFGGEFDRQVAGLFAFENPADVGPGAAISVRLTRSVADQAANLGVLALIIHRRQGMPGSERHELSALAEEKWTDADEQPACARLHDLCEGGMDFSLVGRVHHQDLVPDGTGRFLQVSRLALDVRTVWVAQDRDHRRLGNQLVQHSKQLGHQRDKGKDDTRDIAARPVEACDQANSDRIGSDDEYNGRRRGCRFARLRRISAGPYDRGHLPADEIGREPR